MSQRIAVLGSGISGLACAYHLSKWLPSAQITVIEKSKRIGGWMQSTKVEHAGHQITFESGPRTLRPVGHKGWATLSLIDELGISDQILPTAKDWPGVKYRFLFYPDRLAAFPLPKRLWEDRNAPHYKGLFSGMLKESFRPRSTAADESVHDFFARRLNEDFANVYASALVHGIFAGDSKQLSMKSCFPEFWRREQIYGSLTNAMLFDRFSQHARKEQAEIVGFQQNIHSDVVLAMSQAALYTLRDGLETLPKTMMQALRSNPQVTFQTNTDVQSIEDSASGMTLKTDKEEIKVDKVISTIPFNSVKILLPSALSHIEPIQSVSAHVVNLAYPQEVHPIIGFGMLYPQAVPAEHNPHHALGIVFDSDAAPFLDIPSPYVKYTVMMGGHYYNDGNIPSLEDAYIKALNVMAKGVGIGADPVTNLVALQKDCIPQYHVGHSDKLRDIRKVIHDKFNGKLGLIGPSYNGVGVNDCLYAARKTAWELAQGKLPALSTDLIN